MSDVQDVNFTLRYEEENPVFVLPPPVENLADFGLQLFAFWREWTPFGKSCQ